MYALMYIMMYGAIKKGHREVSLMYLHEVDRFELFGLLLIIRMTV